MDWRRLAVNMVSVLSTTKWRPLGCTVTVKLCADLAEFGMVSGIYWLSYSVIFHQTLILPSNLTPLGALPARFRRERVLIVGCGDIGLRLAALIKGRVRVLALTSTPARVTELTQHGIQPLIGNLDHAKSLHRLSGIAQRIVHLAPPATQGWQDERTQNLLHALRRRSAPKKVVYASTSGVYGDCAGQWVIETTPVHPETQRAHRRVDAENTMRFWGRSGSVQMSILRVPGIYAPDREGGTPYARLSRATPVLCAEDDVYTNHIHADDLARATLLALWRGKSQRVYNVNDDTCLKMGDYFDLAANLYGLPRPPRISRVEAPKQVSAMLLSFMQESRRMVNMRMKQELGVKLLYPTVSQGLGSNNI